MELTVQTQHRWSVVLVVPVEEDVVAIAREFDPTDINLPGGWDEYTDLTPADTAKRELLEETGLQAKAFELIDYWENKNKSITYVYKITLWTGKLRSSCAGKTFLAKRDQFCKEECTFSKYNKRALDKIRLS